MKIGFDISPLTSKHAGRGTGTYTKHLLESLQKHSETYQLVPFNGPIPSTIDLVHFPYFDPFFLTLPRNVHIPFIVTVHDLIPIVYKEHFPVGLRGNIKWFIQKRTLQRATAIITDSYASKTDIVQELHVPESRISVSYLAPGVEFCPVEKYVKEAIRQKYSLPKEFLLYVGDVNWNKNIPNLIKAISQSNIPLVLVGKAFLNSGLDEVKHINSVIEEYKAQKKIIKLGFVSQDDLPGLYSLATACVLVSVAEGFGLPILEAMACGTPCVVSSTSSLVEIAGPSVLVDPFNVNSILNGIKEALLKKWNQKELISYAKQFSWEKTAGETLALYKKCLS